MKQRPRIYYTDSQRVLMWERWKEGASLHQIARLFDRAHTSVRGVLAETGGIRPPERQRSRLALTLAEREEISRAVVAGQSIRVIGARLGRAPSTVSREIKRNGGRVAIGRLMPTRLQGIELIAPSVANWLRTEPWLAS